MSSSPASRGLIGLAGGVLAGAISGAMLVYSLLPPESYLAAVLHVAILYLVMIPLLLAGLGAGVLSGAVASLTGVGGLYFADMQVMIVYAVFCAVPAALLTAMVLKHQVGQDQKVYWSPEGHALTAIALYPCIVFLLMIVGTLHEEGGLLGLTTQMLNKSIGQARSEYGNELADMLAASIGHIARILPAIVGSAWVLLTILSFYAAHAMLRLFKLNLRTRFALTEMRIPNWLIITTAATGLVGLLAPAPYDYIGVNLCALLCLPFLFVGLAVVHMYAASTRVRGWILTIYYLLLSLPWTMFPLLVATLIMGVVDQWVDFRRRFAAGSQQGG